MSHIEPLPRAFYARPTLEVARDLLGKALWRRTDVGLVGGVIVECEAYISAIDPAAHAYRGKTERNAAMFEAAGTAYVYRSYGIHACINVVTESAGVAAAVLLRAARPTVGLELMRQRRGAAIADRDLARGPGRLCQAFGLTLADNGANFFGPDLWLSEPTDPTAFTVATTPRIGITRAADWPWRFALVGDKYVSGKPG